MRYEFQAEDGDICEVEMSPDDAPGLGEPLVFEGVTYKRIFSSTAQICGAHEGSTRFPRFESKSMPRYWKHHKGDFSPQGHPRFASRNECDEASLRATDDTAEHTVKYGEL